MDTYEIMVIMLIFAAWFVCTILINRRYNKLRKVQKARPFEKIMSESLKDGMCVAVTTYRREVLIGYVARMAELSNEIPHDEGVTIEVIAREYLDKNSFKCHVTSAFADRENPAVLTIRRSIIQSVENYGNQKSRRLIIL
jgi:hypothetical protein